ncbi:EAL domain-containing protein [Aeromonas veronii]|uniref:EAL domain-containing protein n=1 Tax=Aeromonas veronii TaxID=654 RepID=UPI00406BC013
MRKSPVWIALLLFVLPVVGSQFLGLWFAKPMAFHMLEEKVAELKGAMAVRHRELDAAINKQLAQFEFNCGAKDMELLRDPRFYSAHIRLQGLELASGNSCSSLGVEIPLIKELQNSGQKFGKLGITATVAKYNTEQELVAFYRSGDNLAYWVLDNSWSHDLLQHPCSHCFYLEFSRQDTDASTVHFPRGDKEIKQEESNISLSFFDPNELTKQTVWAGKALEQYAHDQLNHYGLWFGIALGALLSVTYWLLRWQRGNELIPPGTFIEYAEEQGLILPMTEQLLEQVITDLPQLAPEQWVSVNLVAAHIEQPLLRTLLAHSQNPSPTRLTFELTERKPILDIKAATEEITLLQQMGYHFKLDDFGTGYGGFAYLQSLGIRQIKIDKMFVDTIGTNDLKRSVLDAIIVFGRESGMEMIAEGVESQLQVDYLSQHGVYLIQGYFFGKPMPLKILTHWQREWQLQHQKAS